MTFDSERIVVELVGAGVQSAWVGLILIAASMLVRRVSAPWRFAWLAAGLVRFALPPLPSPLHVSVPSWPSAGPLMDGASAATSVAAPAVVTIWAAGALFQLMRLVRARLRASRLLAGAMRREAPASLIEETRSAAHALGVAMPRAGVSDQVDAPLVVGLRRPTVIVDEGWFELDPRARRLVLFHELAHVKRRDLLWIELASWISVAWWWHPVFRLLVSQLRSAQEEACDDLAMSVAPEHDRYCHVLLEVARAAARPVPAPVLAPLGFDGRTLEHRIRRLMNPATRHAARVTVRQWACVALVTMLVFGAFGSHAMPNDGASPRHVRFSLPHPHDHSHSHHH